MTDDDIDKDLKELWIEFLNPYNSELIANLTEIERNVSHILKYQGNFNFVMGRYEQALTDLIKLLEFETNNVFALSF